MRLRYADLFCQTAFLKQMLDKTGQKPPLTFAIHLQKHPVSGSLRSWLA